MPRIKKIVRCENKGSFANITVELEDGSECVVFVGGNVSVWFDDKYNRAKAFVLKSS